MPIRVEVTLYDNRNYKAEVIGVDPDTDIACHQGEPDWPSIPVLCRL
jgi:S1-C subfamily serine protease